MNVQFNRLQPAKCKLCDVLTVVKNRMLSGGNIQPQSCENALAKQGKASSVMKMTQNNILNKESHT